VVLYQSRIYEFRNSGINRLKNLGILESKNYLILEIPKFLNSSKEPCPQGGASKPKFQNPKLRSRNKFGMTKKPEPNRHVMLNLFQHLVCFFLPSADTPFIPVHRTGFSGAILINYHFNLSCPSLGSSFNRSPDIFTVCWFGISGESACVNVAGNSPVLGRRTTVLVLSLGAGLIQATIKGIVSDINT
jgi:hypothetical protein